MVDSRRVVLVINNCVQWCVLRAQPRTHYIPHLNGDQLNDGINTIILLGINLASVFVLVLGLKIKATFGNSSRWVLKIKSNFHNKFQHFWNKYNSYKR